MRSGCRADIRPAHHGESADDRERRPHSAARRARAGHIALAVPETDLPSWRAHLETHGVEIESDVRWPRGGRSLYMRDPAGNSVEIASPTVWGSSESRLMPELVRRRWGAQWTRRTVQVRATSTALSSRLAEASRCVTSGPPRVTLEGAFPACQPRSDEVKRWQSDECVRSGSQRAADGTVPHYRVRAHARRADQATPNARDVEGLHELTTHDGMRVNVIGDNEYLIPPGVESHAGTSR